MANNVSVLDKVTYVDNSTVIGAANLNAVQDKVIELENEVNTYGNAAELSYTVVSTF